MENGRFVSCTGEPAGEEAVVDAEGMYLIPGLVDIHFHGCKGADMCDGTKEALDVITSYEASVGVTSVCPATMTIPKDELLEVMKNAGSYDIRWIPPGGHQYGRTFYQSGEKGCSGGGHLCLTLAQAPGSSHF